MFLKETGSGKDNPKEEYASNELLQLKRLQEYYEWGALMSDQICSSGIFKRGSMFYNFETSHDSLVSHTEIGMFQEKFLQQKLLQMKIIKLERQRAHQRRWHSFEKRLLMGSQNTNNISHFESMLYLYSYILIITVLNQNYI